MHIIDTHTHLYQPAFDGERAAAMERCMEADVKTFYCPTSIATSIERVHAMMDEWPDRCFGMMGLHPCHVKPDAWQNELQTIDETLHSSGRQYVSHWRNWFRLALGQNHLGDSARSVQATSAMGQIAQPPHCHPCAGGI